MVLVSNHIFFNGDGTIKDNPKEQRIKKPHFNEVLNEYLLSIILQPDQDVH